LSSGSDQNVTAVEDHGKALFWHLVVSVSEAPWQLALACTNEADIVCAFATTITSHYESSRADGPAVTQTPTANPHVLIVDDDPDVRELVLEYLGKNDMRVSAASSGKQMFELFDREAIDLVLLDLKLPGEDGMQLARALRERATVPIVLLTGRNEEADRVMGLELGADDYVTKPFSPRELLARVRAVMRRYQVQATLPERDNARRAFRFSGWVLNMRTRRLISPAGDSVELSNGEFSLLSALCRAPRRVLSRDQLLSMSRLHEAEVYDRTIDVQIRRLRMKVEPDAANPTLILTERGAGYRLDADVESLY
jgi:DNA-binding response OmpR family regulator